MKRGVFRRLLVYGGVVVVVAVGGFYLYQPVRIAGGRWLVRFATHAPNWTFDLTGFDVEHRRLLDLHRSQWTGEKEARVWGTVFESGTEDGERIGKEYGLAARATMP